MPAYRSHDYGPFTINVRPTGWRRLWIVRWWFPYFTGSNFKLKVDIDTKVDLNVNAKFVSELEEYDTWLMHFPTNISADNSRSFIVQYPREKILPNGASKALINVNWANGDKRKSYQLVACKFIAWDPDEFMFRRLVPFVIFIAATVSIGILA